MRTLALSGAALLVAALLAWTPQPVTGFDSSTAEATLWQLLNSARANNGVRVLQQSPTLVSLARWRSKDMVDRNYFDHTVLGTGYEVYHWYDSNGLSYVWGGENIGWNNGFSDADSPIRIHEGFMTSTTGHYENMMQPSWTHGGVGAYGADNIVWGPESKVRSPRLYTELFMQAKAAAPAPIAAQRVSFAAGTYTGYRYNSAFSVITARKAYLLTRASSASADHQRLIAGKVYLHIINGVWANYWVPVTAGVVLTLSPAQRVLFAAGTYTGYRYNSAFSVITARKAYLLTRSSSASADQERLIAGKVYLHIINGVWANYWVPVSAAVVLQL